MVKKILVSQPTPSNMANSPFSVLIDNHGVEVDFVPFIKVEGVSSKEFRQQRIDILEHTSVIFTSMNMVDNFFRICEESRIAIPETMKYFCVTESIALYLQKYIVYRKRKIFFGKSTFVELMEVIVKHSNDLFFMPVSEPHKPEITQMLQDAKIQFTESVMSRTVPQNLKEKVKDINEYDLILLYSPISIETLAVNYGEEAKKLNLAVFGMNTALTAYDGGYNLMSIAPTEKAPSLVNAIEIYIKELKKKGKVDTSYIKPLIDAKIQSTHDMFVKVTTTKVRKSSTSKPRVAKS